MKANGKGIPEIGNSMNDILCLEENGTEKMAKARK